MTNWPGSEALGPFFGIVDEGLDDLVDGEHFFDTLQTTPSSNSSSPCRATHDVSWARDAGVVVLEYAVHGPVIHTTRAYNNRFVSIITIKDRRITHWRDYLDPTAVFDAVGWPARRTFETPAVTYIGGGIEVRQASPAGRALVAILA